MRKTISIGGPLCQSLKKYKCKWCLVVIELICSKVKILQHYVFDTLDEEVSIWETTLLRLDSIHHMFSLKWRFLLVGITVLTTGLSFLVPKIGHTQILITLVKVKMTTD